MSRQFGTNITLDTSGQITDNSISPLKFLPKRILSKIKHNNGGSYDPSDYNTATLEDYENLAKDTTLEKHINHVHARLSNQKYFDFTRYYQLLHSNKKKQFRYEKSIKKGHTHRLINAIVMLTSSINNLNVLYNSNFRKIQQFTTYYRNIRHKNVLNSFKRRYPSMCKNNCIELSLTNVFNMLNRSVKSKSVIGARQLFY